jgi:hypothetical protein
MTKWEARITYSAQEKVKKSEVQTRSSHFNEMLAEDANLLPDRLLSSLLSLSLSSWRNSCRHTRRYEASGNTTKRIPIYKAGRSKRQYYHKSSEARESQRQYDLQDVHVAVKQKTCRMFSDRSLILWLLQIKYTHSKDDAQNRKLDYRENLE